MPFKASKVRKKREPKPAGEGTQLIASAAVREWYERRLDDVAAAMLDDYRKELNDALQMRDVRKHFAQDASAEAVLTDVLSRLDKKWTSIFKNYAKMTAAAFVEKVDEHSKATCWHSMTTAGIEQPRMSYTRNIENTLGAAQTFNNTLITNVQRDMHEKVFSAVMLSLTSPNPEEQGTGGIENALKKTGEFSRTRMELIARDQNSKLYSSLNIDRLRDNGIEKFRWIHSSAGKVPRPSHVAKDDEIFTMDDPRLWQGPKADQGPPGWAINCLPGDASVQFAQEAQRIYRRFFRGELVEITTLRGTVFRGTPNHPILTKRGWVALQDLNMFDDVVEAISEMPAPVKGDDDKRAPTFSDVFTLGERNFSFQLARTAQNDFHGDGIANGDVDIVNVAGKLSLNFLAKRSKGIDQIDFAETNLAHQSVSPGKIDFVTVLLSTAKRMGFFNKPHAFIPRRMAHAVKHGFAAIARRFAMVFQNLGDDLAGAFESIGDVFDTFSFPMHSDDFGRVIAQRMPIISKTPNFTDKDAFRSEPFRQIVGVASNDFREIFESAAFRKELSRVVKIDRRPFAGHVYNLQTKSGWYVADGIITHNCRCRAIPIID
jgi:hypothetical protein